jgi:hypothetical protein
LEHVQNGKSLLAMGEDGAALLNHMVAVGEQLLKEKGYSVQQARYAKPSHYRSALWRGTYYILPPARIDQ